MSVKQRLIDNFPAFARSRGGFRGHLVCFDPGERTGWCWFHMYELVECGEIPTGDVVLAYNQLQMIVKKVLDEAEFNPRSEHAELRAQEDQVRMAAEDYRVYAWKSDSHAWSQVHTIKVVALCELVAAANALPYRMRIAQHAKIFATDQRLQKWGLWIKGQKHARDAIRHACLYIADPKNEVGKK